MMWTVVLLTLAVLVGVISADKVVPKVMDLKAALKAHKKDILAKAGVPAGLRVAKTQEHLKKHLSVEALAGEPGFLIQYAYNKLTATCNDGEQYYVMGLMANVCFETPSGSSMAFEGTTGTSKSLFAMLGPNFVRKLFSDDSCETLTSTDTSDMSCAAGDDGDDDSSWLPVFKGEFVEGDTTLAGGEYALERFFVDSKCNGDVMFLGGRNNYCFNYYNMNIKYSFPKVRAYANADCTGSVLQTETVGKEDKCHAGFTGNDDWNDPIFNDDGDDDRDDDGDDDDGYPSIRYVQHTLTDSVGLIQPVEPDEPFTVSGSLSMTGVTMAAYISDQALNDVIMQTAIAAAMSLSDASAVTVTGYSEVNTALSVHGMRGYGSPSAANSVESSFADASVSYEAKIKKIRSAAKDALKTIGKNPSATSISSAITENAKDFKTAGNGAQATTLVVQYEATVDPVDLGLTGATDAFDAVDTILQDFVSSGALTALIQTLATAAGTDLTAAEVSDATASASYNGGGGDSEDDAFPVGGIIGIVVGGVVFLGLLVAVVMMMSRGKNNSVGVA
eukprot:gene25512-30801_t